MLPISSINCKTIVCCLAYNVVCDKLWNSCSILYNHMEKVVHCLMGKFSDKWDDFFFFSMLYGSLGGSSTAKT